MIRILILLFLTAPLFAKEVGILVLAHGGSERWNQTVKRSVSFLEERFELEVVFTMGEPELIEEGINSLEKKGIKEIVVVPLYISSHSPIMRQIRYLLGFSEEFPERPIVMWKKEEIRELKPLINFVNKLPPNLSWWIWERKPKPETFRAILEEYSVEEEKRLQLIELYRKFLSLHKEKLKRIKPIKTKARIHLTEPLDDHPAIVSVVCDRIRELSKDPENETVVIVAHGPNDEEDNRKWLLTMEKIAKKCNMGFRNIFSVTVRDDAPEPIYEQAKTHLRALVRQASLSGDVIVIPLLVAPGGIEKGIEERLEGLKYRWNGKTILPHPAIRRFVMSRILEKLGSFRVLGSPLSSSMED
jgi:sirohydrochlorin ferrochelatase